MYNNFENPAVYDAYPRFVGNSTGRRAFGTFIVTARINNRRRTLLRYASYYFVPSLFGIYEENRISSRRCGNPYIHIEREKIG